MGKARISLVMERALEQFGDREGARLSYETAIRIAEERRAESLARTDRDERVALAP